MDECVQGKVNEQRINDMGNWMQNLNNSLEKLNENIESLPEKLKSDIAENIDLKIENRIKSTEVKFFKYIVGLGIVIIGNIIYLIIIKLV